MGTLLEDVFCNRQRRKHIRPPDIEGQVRENLRRLQIV